MSDAALTIAGWVLIVLGSVGCIFPVIPGPPLAYAALFVALARSGHSSPSISVIIAAGVVTALAMLLDFIVPSLGAKRFHCSRLGMFGCFIGTILGLFFLPLGVVAGPFVGAFAGEILSGKNIPSGLFGALGALIGFLCGVVVKLAACGAIAYWYYNA